MFRNALLCFLILLIPGLSLVAQKRASFDPLSHLRASEEILKKGFTDFIIFNFETSELVDPLREEPTGIHTHFEINKDLAWDLTIVPNDLRGVNYSIVVQGERAQSVIHQTANKTFKGYNLENNKAIRLTLDKDFIYGYIEDDKGTFFIEPLWYFNPKAPLGTYVGYYVKDIIPSSGVKCGVNEIQERKSTVRHFGSQNRSLSTGNCLEVEFAIASDGLMFNKYGSVTNVENHNIGVMNNVQGNYDNEFADEISFNIVEQFVSTSPSADPWTASTNSGDLLDDFTDWGPSGFSVTHDIGSLWSDRDFNGGTIGLAWVGAVCTNFRYHILQDFSSNAQLLRVLTAHEIGHNFDATHDPSGSNTIMAPSVNSANSWSSQTESEVNSFVSLIDPPNGCLAFCPPAAPPSPGFSANVNFVCAGSFVTFFDSSTGSPTSWSWSFPGATPSSSTQ